MPVFGTMRLRCYPDSASATLAIYYRGLQDYHEMTFMRHYLRPGDGFVDVGANIGVYTLLAASLVGEGGLIECFEPDPVALARLRENLAINSVAAAHVYAAAVGAAPVRGVPFVKDRDSTGRIQTRLDEGEPVISVPCVQLDQVLLERQYAMGKLDIEGAEPLALMGAENSLVRQNPPVWQIELNGLLRAYGFAEQGFADWIAERGYDCAVYDADRRELHFDERPWEERPNVLAIARSRRGEVLTRLREGTDPRPRAAS